MQMANNANRCPTSLVIRETLIKIIMRYHFTPIGIKILPKKITTVGEEVKKFEALCIIGGNVK